MVSMNVLDRPALVLNRNWVAIQTTTVKEAIGLVAKGSARIIEPESFATHDLAAWNDVSRAKAMFGDAVIRSARLEIAPPEVILLTAYAGMGERAVVFSRRNLFKRDRFTCQYCGAQPGPEELTIDHVVPRSRGGVSSWENCVLACVACNARKADRSPTQAGLALRGAPRKPSWRSLARIEPRIRRESWEQFLTRAYWEVELES
jgi:5-methylcytosine-specific restriction endonuclease McrA